MSSQDLGGARTQVSTAGDGSGATHEASILDAIRSALLSEMERDDRVMVLGMDVGRLGGVFRATHGLLSRFGPDRVVDTPMSEGAIVGAFLGLAIGGIVPVAEIQFLGFTHQAFHQIGFQLARYRFRSRGRYHAQVTIRAPFGGGIRTPEFHPDSIEAQFTQTPGIQVVCPAFPDDAKGLLLSAIRDPDPVMFLEPQKLYRSVRGPVPDGDYTVPFGVSRVVRQGTDITLIAWSAAVHLAGGRASGRRGGLGIGSRPAFVGSTGRGGLGQFGHSSRQGGGGAGSSVDRGLRSGGCRHLAAGGVHVIGCPRASGSLARHAVPTWGVGRLLPAVVESSPGSGQGYAGVLGLAEPASAGSARSSRERRHELRLLDVNGRLADGSAGLLSPEQIADAMRLMLLSRAIDERVTKLQRLGRAGTYGPVHGQEAAVVRRHRGVVLDYFGEGASSEGDFHEAANLAGVQQVPLIFLLINNRFAISTPISKQTAAPSLAARAEGYGFPGVAVDGNDLFAVYAATSEAVARALNGDGPTLIEARTYRIGFHNTSDNPKEYREEAEVKAAAERDPIERLRRYSIRAGLWSASTEAEVLAAIETELDNAYSTAAALPRPGPSEVFDHVYATLPFRVRRQRDQTLSER